jgi:para-nitrobenzyl esterase
MLLGNLAHEWVPGVQPPANLKEAIEGSYPADAAKRAVSLYTESGTDSLYGTPAEQWVEDIGFRCSAVAQLVWHTAAKNVAYEFQVEHLPPARRRGNTHAQDVAYVFGRVDGDEYEAVDRAMSDVMQKYWTNFAKTGSPNGPGLPPWPSFDPTSRAYVAFTDEGVVAKTGLRQPFCDLFLDNARP